MANIKQVELLTRSIPLWNHMSTLDIEIIVGT
jgi:hypothetical protein